MDEGVSEFEVRAHWAVVAANYVTSESHATGDDLAWFTAPAAAAPSGRALDVACGGGFSTRALAEAGHDVLATDLTPESLAAARAATDAPVHWPRARPNAFPSGARRSASSRAGSRRTTSPTLRRSSTRSPAR